MITLNTFTTLDLTDLNLSEYQKELTFLFIHYFIGITRFKHKEISNNLKFFGSELSRDFIDKEIFGWKNTTLILNELKSTNNFNWNTDSKGKKFYYSDFHVKNGLSNKTKATFYYFNFSASDVTPINYTFKYKKIEERFIYLSNQNNKTIENKHLKFIEDLYLDIDEANTILDKKVNDYKYETIQELESYTNKMNIAKKELVDWNINKFKTDDFGGRIYNFFTNKTGAIRKILKSKTGVALEEVDIQTSHLYIISQLHNIDLSCINEKNMDFIEDEKLSSFFLNNIDIYTYLMTQWNLQNTKKVDRDFIKLQTFKFLFGDNRNKTFLKLFSNEFPETMKNIEACKEIKFGRFIRTKSFKGDYNFDGTIDFIHHEKSVFLNWLLQRIEVTLFVTPLLNELGFSVHDSFMTYSSNINNVKNIIYNSFQSACKDKSKFIAPILK